MKSFLLAIAAACIVLPSTSASARDIRVGLYSSDPPTAITIVPRNENAKLRKCATCKAESISTQVVVSVKKDRLALGNIEQRASLYIDGAYEIRAAQRAPMQMQAPLELRAAKGRLLLIANLPLEDYVAAVVAGEAGTVRSDEALKAAAVAARTYALRFASRHRAEGFDLCDSTHCQDARFTRTDERVRNAVSATVGELLWFKGTPAASYYSRNCGGRTEDAREVWPDMRAPYLIAHADPHCIGAEDTQWESTISKDEMSRVLLTLPHAPGAARTIVVERRTPSGRNRDLRIIGNHEESYVADEQTWRFAVGRVLGWTRVRSDQFEVRSTEEGFRFSGRGAGHGVGMCQRGAARMGDEGQSYREILAFYYPGTKLGLTSQGLNWVSLRGARVEMLSTRSEDKEVLEAAERIISESERRTGLALNAKPQIRVYPTVETFRDATGESGWIAASTRGNTIRLQPTSILRQRGVLESTLRHELLHLAIESRARVDTPLWFREGLVLYLSGERNAAPAKATVSFELLDQKLKAPMSEKEMRSAYAQALQRTRDLLKIYGEETVLAWLEKGIPAEALKGLPSATGDMHSR